MIEKKKNGLQISLNFLRTNNESFLCMGTSKTLSLREFDECDIHIILIPFLCIFHTLMFNLMQNYRIFTQICVLQGLRAKEAKRARKAIELAKVGSAECHDNFNKEISRKCVATIKTLSRQILRRIQG